MPLYQMKITVEAGNGEEFEKAFRSLWFKFLKEEGCENYDVAKDIENENTFFLVGEFDSQEAMSNHFQSKDFEVLLGAATVLGKIPKMVITQVLEKGGYGLAKSKHAS